MQARYSHFWERLSLFLFQHLISLYPPAFRQRFELEMHATFQEICAARLAEGTLFKEWLHTLWDLSKAIPAQYLWLVIDIGNNKVLSLVGTAFMLAGAAHVSPVCPITVKGDDYAPH